MEKTSNKHDSAVFRILSKTRKSLIRALDQAKRRRKEHMFVVEGRKNVIDLLSNRSFSPVWLVATESFLEDHLMEMAGVWGLPDDAVSVASKGEIAECSSLSTPSDVLAVFRMPEELELESLGPLQNGLYLVLDGVQDPGNLGTIMRTAHWFGIRTIFASSDTVDIYNPKTIQSTMGSLGEVSVTYTDIPSLLLRNPDIPAVGLQLDGEDLFQASLPRSAFICMGSEGNGLSEEVKSLLRHSYTIPPADPFHHPESLNVAVATAITLAAFRQ